MVTLNLRVLLTVILFFAHQATGASMSDIDTNLLQFLGHSRPAAAAQTDTRLFLDVRQDNHIRALPAAGRPATESPQPAGADVHDLTQPVDWEGTALFFDEPEPHDFWLAKNWVIANPVTSVRKVLVPLKRPLTVS